MMKQLNVTLKVNDMPKTMLQYNFPCGETNCPNDAEAELCILTLDSEFKMPVCYKHAAQFVRDIEPKIA